jgi:hypothetical protein
MQISDRHAPWEVANHAGKTLYARAAVSKRASSASSQAAQKCHSRSNESFVEG